VTPRRLLVVTALSLLLVGGACGGDGGKDKDTKVTTGSTAGGEKTDGTAVSLKALLSPAEEVPGPGVKDGIGRVGIDIAGPKVCSDLKVTMGEKPMGAHIHQAAKGMSGPVVVDLKPAFEAGESAYTSKTCVDTTAATASGLIADPAGYYVNIHSELHPDGAMRGQLSKF
jgi:CHRD domain